MHKVVKELEAHSGVIQAGLVWWKPVRGKGEEVCLEIGQRKHGGVRARMVKCFGGSGQVAEAWVISTST